MESTKHPRQGGDTAAITTKRSRFNRICVFCGSSSGKNPVYHHAAVELGKQLVERKIDLVYGGGSIGLMGLVSKAAYDGGCHVLGVIPKVLMPKEIIGETCGDVKLVLNMHQRKAEMARQADAFIALPGGYGTLEELLEVITWSQLGIHQKPVGLLNVDGYYNSLLSFIGKAVDEGFITTDARRIIVSAQTAHELLSKLEMYDEVDTGFERISTRRSFCIDLHGYSYLSFLELDAPTSAPVAALLFLYWNLSYFHPFLPLVVASTGIWSLPWTMVQVLCTLVALYPTTKLKFLGLSPTP